MEWISIQDKLPEIGEEVIVFCPKSQRRQVKALTRFIRYEGATDFFWDNNYGGGNTHVQDAVSHWMPLPVKPQS